jgi:hypothetical protein
MVVGFATADPGGGPDEIGQTFVDTTVTDRLELFSQAPWIDSDGGLRYVPGPDARGSATVVVRVTDSGGTADGGNNTSSAQAFTIRIGVIGSTTRRSR